MLKLDVTLDSVSLEDIPWRKNPGFGTFLKTARERHNLSLREAGRRTGISPGMLRNIEVHGCSGPPTLQLLNALCQTYLEEREDGWMEIVRAAGFVPLKKDPADEQLTLIRRLIHLEVDRDVPSPLVLKNAITVLQPLSVRGKKLALRDTDQPEEGEIDLGDDGDYGMMPARAARAGLRFRTGDVLQDEAVLAMQNMGQRNHLDALVENLSGVLALYPEAEQLVRTFIAWARS